jgi:3-hydroxyacyl-CoA dehydrogenase/enoyl-CoA hydratase/3-hydroxybutyryl-CoA epimerase/enoyl-CoA isomerase
MLPMIIEASLALDEGVVESAAELDAAIRMGLGFPAYAGGPLMYADWLGLREVVRRCAQLGHLGLAYAPTRRMVTMAETGQGFRPR